MGKKFLLLLKMVFPMKYLDKDDQEILPTEGITIKILSPEQTLQRFSVSLAQVKAGNTSQNLFYKIKQIHYLCRYTISLKTHITSKT